MPEYIQAIEKFLSDNPNLGKSALVQLLTAWFPKLNKAEASTCRSLLQREEVVEHLKSGAEEALRGVTVTSEPTAGSDASFDP